MPGSLNPTAMARLLGPWNTGAAPAYRELAGVVRLLVMDGRIPLDVALPSERALAVALGVSRTTVTAAYASLREQGFLSGGQGTRGRRASRTGRFPSADRDWPFPEGILDLAYASLPATGEVVHRAFADALIDLPALLARFWLRRRRPPAPPGSHRGTLHGSRHPHDGRANTCHFGSPARAEHHPEDPRRAATESPRGASQLSQRARRDPRFRLPQVPVPMPPAAEPTSGSGAAPAARRTAPDIDAGWDIDGMVSAMRHQRPAMAYLVPDFHNPTGRIMSNLQRRRLVREAAVTGTVLWSTRHCGS